MRKRQIYSLVAVLTLVFAAFSSAAIADPIPVYEGATDFPTIHGPLDPEDYSWEVELGEEWELRQDGEHSASVYYPDGEHIAFSIADVRAHDATGKSVPTTLTVSPPNIVTLTVHHRAGNPAAGGAPFTYPIDAGSGYEVGPSSVQVIMPLSEPLPARDVIRKPCLVPKVEGKTLVSARERISSAGCRISRVHRKQGTASKRDRVIAQSPGPGTSLPLWAPVVIRLG